jgi:hypothetical protein
LLLEPIDRILTGPERSQFGARANSKPKKFVSALNDLEWLAEIVPGYSEQPPSKSEILWGFGVAVITQPAGRAARLLADNFSLWFSTARVSFIAPIVSYRSC